MFPQHSASVPILEADENTTTMVWVCTANGGDQNCTTLCVNHLCHYENDKGSYNFIHLKQYQKVCSGMQGDFSQIRIDICSVN